MKYSDLLFDYLNSINSEASQEFDCVESQNGGFKKDYYEIKTDEESRIYNKPKGKYILLSTPDMLDLGKAEVDKSVEIFTGMLKSIFGEVSSDDRVLVVGLGNRYISSDSLGAKVVGKINITINNKLLPKVMAIAPSVMGLTGIETFDIVEGVASRVKPTHLILIDSLCASAVERLGRSIQVTNTGICPGGGIGNKRKCIDGKIVKNVYSIGVPLLIFSSTFIGSAFEKFGIGYEKILGIMQSSRKSPENSELLELSKTLKKVIEDDENEMIVSIKDIEECVDILSDIIARSINIALGVC